MSELSDVRFIFKAAKFPEEKFALVRLYGHEAISELYRFELDLVSSDPDIDLGAVINQPAAIGMERADGTVLFHGLISHFEQGDQGPEFVSYRAVLVPRLFLLDLTRQNRIFLEKDLKTILLEVLLGNGLFEGKDFEIHLFGNHPAREYVVQYQETDLNFICRQMEHEGVYFHFEHGKDQDKLIIADRKDIHKPIAGDPIVLFRDARMVNPGGESVSSLTLRQQILPRQVILKDYNYRKPSLEVKGEAEAVKNGFGALVEYGDHFKDPEEGNRLALIRAEEVKSREKLYSGEGAVRAYQCGHTFTLEDHFRASNNIKYLLVSVEHLGEQLGVVGSAAAGETKRIAYSNRFEAIPADVQYRPPRNTPKPRISGIMHAEIDAGGSGQYAEIDDMGRYKVKLPFDLSGRNGGKASRYMRMGQPYAGGNYGMHFPQHKGTEVALTHVDGDPDRPVVAHAMPNPAKGSPVTGPNQTQSVIRTAAGNEIVIEDLAGSERVLIHSPYDDSRIWVGSPPSTGGIRATTNGHGVIHAKKGIYLNAWPTDYWATGDASRVLNAGVAAAGTVGAAAAGAGGGGLAFLGAVVGTIGAIANVAAPGIVLASPAGISAATPSTFTAVGLAGVGMMSPASANIVGVASAALMSGGGVDIYTIRGGIRMVASFGDVEIKAKHADIKGTAKNNIILTAETNNVNIIAHNELDCLAEEKDVFLNAAKANVMLLAKKDVNIGAEEESVTINGKKSVYLCGDTADVLISANATKTIIKAKTELILECGKSKITLFEDGKITITGKTIAMSTDGASSTFDDKGYDIGGDKGKVTAGDLHAEALSGGTFVIKGGMVKIN